MHINLIRTRNWATYSDLEPDSSKTMGWASKPVYYVSWFKLSWHYRPILVQMLHILGSTYRLMANYCNELSWNTCKHSYSQRYYLLGIWVNTFYLMKLCKMSSINSFISENTINGVVPFRSKRFLHMRIHQ